MIWRRELAIYFRRLAIDEARALATLRRGASFSVLCSQLAKRERPEQAAVRAATLLKRWLREGLLTAHEASTPR